MTSQVLNFLWLNFDLPAPPDPKDGSIREPLPAKYIGNVRTAGMRHPKAEMALWVDSKRLTKKQMAYLKQSIEDGLPNVHLRDLRDISDYDRLPLYNEPETNANWRSCGQTSLIWRQVDAAKVLISLQGDFDQKFFADLDHSHLSIASTQVQRMLEKHGLMIGSNSDDEERVSIENQLWGFTRSRQEFFERYYLSALNAAHRGENAWSDLCRMVRDELEDKEKIPLREFCLPIGADGTQAEQPGHALRMGLGNKMDPSSIPLTGAFNKISKKKSMKANPPVQKYKEMTGGGPMF